MTPSQMVEIVYRASTTQVIPVTATTGASISLYPYITIESRDDITPTNTVLSSNASNYSLQYSELTTGYCANLAKNTASSASGLSLNLDQRANASCNNSASVAAGRAIPGGNLAAMDIFLNSPVTLSYNENNTINQSILYGSANNYLINYSVMPLYYSDYLSTVTAVNNNFVAMNFTTSPLRLSSNSTQLSIDLAPVTQTARSENYKVKKENLISAPLHLMLVPRHSFKPSPTQLLIFKTPRFGIGPEIQAANGNVSEENTAHI